LEEGEVNSMTKDECADWIAAEAEEEKKATVERKRLAAEEKKKATVERKRLEAEEKKKATVERKRLEAEETKATAERKRLEAEETKVTAERKRLAEKPMREAATAKRAKVKRVDVASDKQDAALYLKTNTQYAIDFMANNKERITPRQSLTSRSGVLMRRIADLAQTNCLVSVLLGRNGELSLDFLAICWGFGTFETIQTANYAFASGKKGTIIQKEPAKSGNDEINFIPDSQTTRPSHGRCCYASPSASRILTQR
jgi:hypothetical protein